MWVAGWSCWTWQASIPTTWLSIRSGPWPVTAFSSAPCSCFCSPHLRPRFSSHTARSYVTTRLFVTCIATLLSVRSFPLSVLIFSLWATCWPLGAFLLSLIATCFFTCRKRCLTCCLLWDVVRISCLFWRRRLSSWVGSLNVWRSIPTAGSGLSCHARSPCHRVTSSAFSSQSWGDTRLSSQTPD